MSLINKMLQDLDARAEQSTTPEPAIIDDLRPANDASLGRHGVRYARFLIFLVILLVAATGLVFFYGSDDFPSFINHNPSEAGTSPESPVVVDSQSARDAASPDSSQSISAPAPQATIPAQSPAAGPDKPETVAAAPSQTEPVKSANTDSADSVSGQAAGPVTGKTMNKPVKIARPSTPEQLARTSFQSAVAQYRKGHISQAEQYLQQTLAYQPEHVQARSMLASMMLQENRWPEARQQLLEGMTRTPQHYAFNMQLAQMLVNRKQENEAIVILENALPRAAYDADYLGFLATLYQRGGRPAEAADMYSMALEQQPLAGKWWLGLGLSLESLHNPEAASAAYVNARLSNALTPQLDDFAQQRIKQLTRPDQATAETR